MNVDTLNKIAKAMVMPGKGILAMDESHPTCAKRFEALGIPTTEEKRREYRDMLLTTENLSDYISGAILFDETIRQKTLDNTPFPDYMQKNGIIIGIKVDAGAKPLANHNGETVTEGLDGLRSRLNEYHTLGARFAKWRGVYSITNDLPSKASRSANAHALARYAALCQEAGIVPIVEPEVLINGSHSIERCYDVTKHVQLEVFEELDKQGVKLEGIVLKPSMVISGLGNNDRASRQVVAEKTIECLLETVPAIVPGIAFLSGGQTDDESSEHLSLMHNLGKELPWSVTFSYGRALQHASMMTWNGNAENKAAAQKVVYHRAKMNGLASLGKYKIELESELS